MNYRLSKTTIRKIVMTLVGCALMCQQLGHQASRFGRSIMRPMMPVILAYLVKQPIKLLVTLRGNPRRLHPKAVVILIGINNIGKYHDQPERVAAGIRKIVAMLKEKLPQSQIVLLGIFPCGNKHDARRAKVADVNDMISRVNFGPQVHHLDLGPKFLDANGDLPKELFCPGGKYVAGRFPDER